MKMQLIWDVRPVSDLFMAFCSEGVLSLLKLSNIPLSIHKLPHRFTSHGPRTLRNGPQGTKLLQRNEDGVPSLTIQEVLQENKHNWIPILIGNISIAHKTHSLIRNPCQSLLRHQTLHMCVWVGLWWAHHLGPFTPGVQMYFWDQSSIRRYTFSL